jgi:protein involved in polysaccharide export with SLBB domain
MIENKATGIAALFVVMLFFFVVTPVNQVFAQKRPDLNFQNLNQVKVDDLTDQQVLTFWRQARASGYTKNQLEALARERKMPEQEVQKLLLRIEKIEEKALQPVQQKEEKKKKDEADDKLKYTDDKAKEQTDAEAEIIREKQLDELLDQLVPQVFGADVFTNSKITFEPSLNIPTPANYILGAGDELAVDIYGYSEASYLLKVTPDGAIRIPGAGLIKVAGASIEQARTRITNELRSVYSTIASGQTRVNVSISNIRSIKVTVVGEAQAPGTYTLPSLATVFNVLHSCGGPSQNGSMRNISVIRGGKTIATVDVYEFLVKGNAKSNIALQDQDIVKINPYEARVEVKGEVKRPALFEVKPKETLKDVLEFAGGFTTKAYTEKIKVQRNTPTQKSVADVDAALFAMFIPTNGDVYTIGELLERFENRVTIEGAVFRPGEYGLTSGMTVKQLVKQANGLTEDALTTRAILYRLKDDNSLEMLSFNIGSIMNGTEKDITLKREDKILIASKLEMREQLHVRIEGEVLMPGKYDFAEKMKLEDLIIAAGGLKESASIKHIQVGRRVMNADRTSPITEIANVFTISVEKDLKENPQAASFELLPFDIITVFPEPGYVPQKTVKVFGQVIYPGEFVISKNKERISEVIKRAGGLTNEAFPEGAILIRYKLNNLNEQFINYNKIRALKKLSDDQDVSRKSKEDEFKMGYDLVAINLDKVLKNPGGKDDIYLFDRDIINIPMVRQTVLVSGEVLFPVRLVYTSGMSFRNCISGSGGFTTQALKRKAYVVYNNGSAKSTKNFLLFKIHPKIKPGCEIIIPPKEKREKLSTAETISIVTSTTTLLLIMTTTLFNVLKP